MEACKKELSHLINRHSIENVADTPDFILAEMICRMIEAMGPCVKQTLDWHGCNSVCHPGPSRDGGSGNVPVDDGIGKRALCECCGHQCEDLRLTHDDVFLCPGCWDSVCEEAKHGELANIPAAVAPGWQDVEGPVVEAGWCGMAVVKTTIPREWIGKRARITLVE
jgi:hypothetical protein